MDEQRNRLKRRFYCVSVDTTTNAQGTKLSCYLHVERDEAVRGYALQICGENPMTGLDISQYSTARRLVSNIDDRVDFPHIKAYGNYELRCLARLVTGEEIVLHSVPEKLVYAEYTPWLKQLKKATLQNGFTMVELGSNCWRYYKNKECLRCDGVTYPLSWSDDLNPEKRRFYVLGNQIELVLDEE